MCGFLIFIIFPEAPEMGIEEEKKKLIVSRE